MNTSEQSTTNPEPNTQSPSDRAVGAGSRSIVRDGLVGGVVALLLSFVPLSTALGGAVAGYLDADDGRHAAGGAIAGLVAFLPYPIAGLYVVTTPAATFPGPSAALSPAVVAAVVGVALVYAVGLGVLGGFLGRSLYRKQRE